MIYNEVKELVQFINPDKLINKDNFIFNDFFTITKKNKKYNNIELKENIDYKKMYAQINSVIKDNIITWKNKNKKKIYNNISLLIFYILDNILLKNNYHNKNKIIKDIREHIKEYKKDTNFFISLEDIYSLLFFYLDNNNLIYDDNFEIINTIFTYFDDLWLKEEYYEELNIWKKNKNIDIVVIEKIIDNFNKKYLNLVIKKIVKNKKIVIIEDEIDIFKEQIKMVKYILKNVNDKL